MLEVARAAGIDIPTLCSHESLPPYGSCRFCIVEVTQRGRTRMQTSCTLPVAEGMEIKTHSERVMKIRKILVELMLARCPESEVLREMAREIGVPHCRFERVRGEKSPCHTARPARWSSRCPCKRPDGMPSTFVGRSGCILCGMCVRLCDDVMKIGALGFRGPRHAAARDHPFPGTLRVLHHLRRLQFHLPDRGHRVAAGPAPGTAAHSRPSSSWAWPIASPSTSRSRKPCRASRSLTPPLVSTS